MGSRGTVGARRTTAMRAALVTVAAIVAARAAHGETRTISLREAVGYARDHQPSLAAARARVEVARTQAQLPRAAWSPRITAGAELLIGTANNTTASYGGPLGFDVPRIGGTPANASASLMPSA